MNPSRSTPPTYVERIDSPSSDVVTSAGGDGQAADQLTDHTPISGNRNNNDNLLPTNQNASSVAPRTTPVETTPSKPTPPPAEGKRLIRTIRPIDVRKLQQSGLDRKIAEALSKQKQQQTKLTKSAVMGTKVTATKDSISNATIPSNHIKFMKPVSTLSSPTAPTTSPAFILNQTSVTSFKPLPTTPPPVAQPIVTSASSLSAVVAAPPKLLTKKSIIPPKITITGPEAPTDRDRQQMKDLNAEQRMKHVKNLLHRKLLQRQLASATEDIPKLFAHLKPPSNESEKTPPLKTKWNKELLIIPDKISPQIQTPPPVPDNRISATDNQMAPKIPAKPRAKQQVSQMDQETSYTKPWEPLGDPAKSTAIAACSNVDKQYSQTPPVTVRSQQPHQRNTDISYSKPCVPLYNMPVIAYTTVDKQLPQMSPVYVRSSYQQPAQRSQEGLPTKQWGPVYNIPPVTGTTYQNVNKQFSPTSPVVVRSSSQTLHNKSYGQLLYSMPKLLVKTSNNTDKQLLQTSPVNVRNFEESGERTPTNKLPTKPKTPQKSPQDIARKLDFQSDEQPKVPQYERSTSSNISANLVHDVLYDKDPSSLNEIPKASIKPVYTPTSFGNDTLGKHRIVIPDVSPLKTPFPSANIPQEAPLPTIDTFKKPYPLPGVNYYHMSPQSTASVSAPHTGYITTNYQIHPSAAAYPTQHRVQNDYNVTPVMTINTPTAPNSLIVLENKVLSQDEMIDLTALRLSTSKIDAPQRFARPHKPIPEVVIKQEKPDDFPTSSTTENIQEKPIVYRNAGEQRADTPPNPGQGLVFISSKQNKKFIVNAAKLKLPPEKIADLAKKIAESQSLTADRRKEEGIIPNPSVSPVAEMQKVKSPQAAKAISHTQVFTKSSEKEHDNIQKLATDANKTAIQYSLVAQSLNNEHPPGNSGKIQQNTPPRFINSVTNVGQYGQKFFLIVKKDSMASTKVIPKPKSTTGAEILPMTSSHIVQTSTPIQVKQTKKEAIINKSDLEANSFSYTPIKNRKSAVEIIDEPEAEQSTFSAVDFIASLASTNPITEETQLELSPEELNLNASCAMNFSPLRIPFSPRKIKVSTPNQPSRQVVAAAPAESISDLYKENSVQIGNIVTLSEDNNVVNIDPQNVSMSTEIVDTIVIESSKGRDHVLRKSIDGQMPIINTTSCKLKPIKLNVLDSYKLGLPKTKDIEGHKTTLLAKELTESVETSETSKKTSEDNENYMLAHVSGEESHNASQDTSITHMTAHSEQETNEVSEEVYDHKTKSIQILSTKDSQEKILGVPSEQDKEGTKEILATCNQFPDLAVEEASQNLSTKTLTENIEECIPTTKPTEHEKATISSQILQNYPPNTLEKSLQVATEEKVDDSDILTSSKLTAQCTPPTDDPTKQMKEQVAETIVFTKSQSTVDHASTTEETVDTTDNSGSLKSILKSNSFVNDTEKISEETVAKTKEISEVKSKESSDMVVKSKEEDRDILKVGESNTTTAGPSKRISRFKKGKINLVQRNKPSTANSTSVSTTQTLATSVTLKSLESKIDSKPKTIEKSLILPAKSSGSDTTQADRVNLTTKSSGPDATQADCVNETTNGLQFSKKAVEQPITEIRTENEEISTATQSFAAIKKPECETIQTHVLAKDLNLAPKISELPESNQTSISKPKSDDVKTVDMDVENNENVSEDVDKSKTSTKPLENTTGVISLSQQNTEDMSESYALCTNEATDKVKDISIEALETNIPQLINPPKIPKRKSNIKCSKESPLPTAKDMKQVTISLVDIVKNPPSEMPATSPHLPFKRKLEEKARKLDEIKGIRNLLQKMYMPETDGKESGCKEGSSKQNDAQQLASQADVKQSSCNEESSQREEHKQTESQLASQAGVTESSFNEESSQREEHKQKDDHLTSQADVTEGSFNGESSRREEHKQRDDHLTSQADVTEGSCNEESSRREKHKQKDNQLASQADVACNEESRQREEHKQKDDQMATQADVKESACNEESSRRENHKQTESQLAAKKHPTENVGDEPTESMVTKEAQEKPDTLTVAHKANKKENEAQKNDNDNTKSDLEEVESSNKSLRQYSTPKHTIDLTEESKIDGMDTRSRRSKSEGDFKSADELDMPKSDSEQLPSKQDSICDNSKQPYLPSPISSRRSTRLGLGSTIESNTNTASNSTRRCSTRYQKTTEDILDIVPAATDTKSSKKQRKSLSEHNANDKEQIGSTKDKENQISSKIVGNSPRLSETEEHSRQTLFDKVKSTEIETSKLDDLKCGSDTAAAAPTKRTRLCSKTYDAQPFTQDALDKSTCQDINVIATAKGITSSSKPLEVEDSCQDSTQDPKPSGSPNQRKRLRKTLEDIKKSHKLDTDSEDDRDDFDSMMNVCEDPTDFLGFDDHTMGSSKSQNPQEITGDEKSPTKAATTKGGTLKNWLTTGKAISPTSSKDGGSKRLRHAKKSAAIRGIPLKKRWDASTNAQEETDITDDTSPADDEDGENCTQVQRSKRYLKTVIDSNKDLIKTKRLKLNDSDDITKKHTFVEPKPVDPRTRISETDSDTPVYSGRRPKRSRRRLISDDVEEKEEEKNTSKESTNSKQSETDVVGGFPDSDAPKNKQSSSKVNKSIDSEEQAALSDDKVNVSSEETWSAVKATEETVLDLKKTSVKSLKSKNLVRNPLHREVEKKEDPTIKENQDKHTPKAKLTVTPKSRLKRQLKIEEYDDCKKEVRKEGDPIIELTPKARRTYKRKLNIEESAKEEIRDDDGTKRSNRRNNNVEPPTSNPRLQKPDIEDSTEQSQDEKSNIPESCVPTTPTTPSSAKVGRGKYKRKPTPENEFNPRLLLITKREQLETDEVLTETNPGPGPVQCGLCMKRTTEAKWEIHLAEHYGVGWKLGEEELNINYRPSVITIITAYLKDTEIKGLQCRLCHKLYRSGLGLLMHLEVCGAEKQRADCDYCHKNYSILSLPSHLRSCPERTKQSNQNQDTQEIKEEVFSATGRAKRTSTLKAESKLKQMGADLSQNAEDAQDFNPKDHIKYNGPLGDDVRQKWSSDIIKFSKAFCPKKTCPYASDKIDDLEEHIKDCKFVMKIGYYCKQCKRRCFATEKEAISHINSVHRNGKDFSGSDSDCNIKTDDEQSSNDDDLSEGVDENETDENDLDSNSKCDSISPKKKVRSKKPTTTSKANASPAAIMRKRIFPKRRRESTNAFVLQKWKSFLKINYSPEPLFNNFKCQYSVLKTQQYIKYLPNQEMSMKFSTTKDAKLPAILGEPQANIEWNQLGRYKTINHETDAFLFLGAPVTYCSWLPLPAHIEEQYLLVAYRRDMFKFVKFLNPKHVNTSLILFKVTQLKNDGVKRIHIEVHYAVAIEDGPVYSASFIPSGGYSLQDNRLGLVAVASVESLIKVYALPIELTKECDEKSGDIRLIEIEPSFVLNIDVTTTSDTTTRDHVLMSPQCLQVSWSEFSGHNHIFASFSNGFVGIWDVTNDSEENLNRFKVKNVINYAPMNYFYVGEKGIKHFALHYDSNGPRWLAVSSFYRKFVIYDIRNFMQPTLLKEDMARNVIRCLDWCPLWEPVLIGYCDSIPNNGRCVQCISPANVMYHQQKLDNMNSAVTAVHYTPCTNTCVASVDNGDVLFMDCREFHYEQPMGRTFGERRILSAMDIKQLNGKPIERLTKPSDNQQLENEWTMYEYDYKEKYGLVFNPLIKLKDSTKDAFFNAKRRAPLNITPFMRINTLRCNLNKTAKRLVAVGYENGFIRVMYFDKESKFGRR